MVLHAKHASAERAELGLRTGLEHPWLIGVSIAVSLALLLVGAWVGRRVLLRLPPDALARPDDRAPLRVRVRRSLFGAAMILAGVVFLFIPGPGLVLIVVGLLSLDLPWRKHALHWMLCRHRALRRINAFRARHGQPPLQAPPSPT
jgi:hypothetical protein